MAKALTVADDDIVTVEQRFPFGLAGRRHTGDIVRVLDTFTMARFALRDGGHTYREICDTCNGTGFRREYAGLYNGECFPCRGQGFGRQIGTGTPLDLVRAMRRRINDQARRDKARQNAQQARRDEHAIWLDDNPQLADILAHVRAVLDADPSDSTFSRLMRDLACRGEHSVLKPGQCELAWTMFAEGVQTRARRQAAAARREWLGGKGDKVTFTGTLVYTTHASNDFGTSTLYLLTGEDGNRVKWWRSGYWNPELGDTYTVSGTVKDLVTDSTYGKCTVITRGKIQESEPGA